MAQQGDSISFLLREQLGMKADIIEIKADVTGIKSDMTGTNGNLDLLIQLIQRSDK